MTSQKSRPQSLPRLITLERACRMTGLTVAELFDLVRRRRVFRKLCLIADKEFELFSRVELMAAIEADAKERTT